MPRPLVLDVSNNRTIDTPTLKRSGAVALIAKATEGVSFVDATYPEHRRIAHGIGVPFGGYLYLHADSPGDQAAYFVQHAAPRKGDLQPVVDAETGMPRPEGKRAFACLRELEQHGYRPLLYSSQSYLRAMIRDEPALTRYRIWEAAVTRWPWRPHVGMGATVVLWQYTWTFMGRYDASRLLVPLDSLRIG